MVLRMLRISGLLALSLFAGPVAFAQTDTFAVGRNLASAYIINGYEQLYREAELQAVKMDGLCAAPGTEKLADARVQFGALVRAWSLIEGVRFGPILQNNRLERILFYPDRQGIGLRQVQAILGKKDERALSLDTLREKSVAVQGLVALEFVLFGTGADAELVDGADPFRCTYGLRVSQALIQTAQEVLAAWEAPDGIGAHMAAPNAAYDDYRDNDEVLRELLGIFVHTVEQVRDTRLAQLVNAEGRPGSARTALFKRSELTIESAAANIAGLQQALLVTGVADALKADQRWIGGSLDFEMQNFVRTAEEISGLPIAEAVEDPKAQSKLRYLMILTGSIQRILVGQLAASLGLSAGFSALDGD